jgi:hypothetical protein
MDSPVLLLLPHGLYVEWSLRIGGGGPPLLVVWV